MAGDGEAITAFQLDIKCEGLDLPLMADALAQAKAGRLHILEKMQEAMPQKAKLPPSVPRLVTTKINPSKVKATCLPADGIRIATCLPADGIRIATCLPADGIRIATCLPTDGVRIATCLPTHGIRIATCLPADCIRIATCLPADGIRTANLCRCHLVRTKSQPRRSRMAPDRHQTAAFDRLPISTALLVFRWAW